MSESRADTRARSAALERSKARESNRQPRIGEDGIPHCSYDVHVRSQEGQPYGSERRCCNHCGVMLWGASALPFVDNWAEWRASPNNCDKLGPP